MIELGNKAKDKITGFEGIAYARTDWLIGCSRIGIKPRGLHDGKTIDLEWFDEPQVEDLGPSDIKIDAPSARETGGPKADPKSRR